MPRLFVLCGAPGSGKTTAAGRILTETEAEVYSSDEIYAGCNSASFDEITARFHADVRRDLIAGRSVICDGTYATKFVRGRLLDAVSGIPCEKILVVLDTPLEECLRRNASRTGRARVPDHVVRTFSKIYERPDLSEGWDKILYF